MPSESLLERPLQLLLSTGRTLAGKQSLFPKSSAVPSWTFYCLLESSWHPLWCHQCCSDNQCPNFSQSVSCNYCEDMFSSLCKRFRRVTFDSGESRGKEFGLSSKSDDGQRKRFWGMWRKFWAVYVELPVHGVGGFWRFNLTFLKMAHNYWSICKWIEFPWIS